MQTISTITGSLADRLARRRQIWQPQDGLRRGPRGSACVPVVLRGFNALVRAQCEYALERALAQLGWRIGRSDRPIPIFPPRPERERDQRHRTHRAAYSVHSTARFLISEGG